MTRAAAEIASDRTDRAEDSVHWLDLDCCPACHRRADGDGVGPEIRWEEEDTASAITSSVGERPVRGRGRRDGDEVRAGQEGGVRASEGSRGPSNPSSSSARPLFALVLSFLETSFSLRLCSVPVHQIDRHPFIHPETPTPWSRPVRVPPSGSSRAVRQPVRTSDRGRDPV